MRTEAYSDQARAANLLIDRTYDVLVSYGPVEHPDVESVPLVHEYFILSVGRDSPLAGRAGVCIREAKIPTILLLYVKGAFFAGQRGFWESLEPSTRLELRDDFFLYSQRVRNTDVPTLSTFLSRNYRDDGDHRALVPATDPELGVDYHLAYLKSNREALHAFCEWMKKA